MVAHVYWCICDGVRCFLAPLMGVMGKHVCGCWPVERDWSHDKDSASPQTKQTMGNKSPPIHLTFNSDHNKWIVLAISYIKKTCFGVNRTSYSKWACLMNWKSTVFIHERLTSSLTSGGFRGVKRGQSLSVCVLKVLMSKHGDMRETQKVSCFV